MARFRYRSADSTGRIETGAIDQPDVEAARRYLLRRGLHPIEIVADGGAGAAEGPAAPSTPSRRRSTFGRKKRAGADELLFFTRNLALLLRSGLPLAKAMAVLKGMITNPEMSRIRDQVFERVRSGSPLSAALAEHRELFGDLYVNMVRAGEHGGTLDQVLGELADLLERSKQLRSSVISALIYPAILLAISVVSVFLLLGFVVPQFESLFADMGDALPTPTQVVISMGDAVAEYGWLGVILLVGGVALWRRVRTVPRVKAWRDRRVLALPIFGELVSKYETAVFSRTLGTLLKSGVPIVRAIPISVDTIGNRQISRSMADVHARVKQGEPLSATLAQSGMFSDMAIQMLKVGEETGRSDEMLLDIAKISDSDVQLVIKRALTLVEPILILGLGTVIGAIITSILLGIISVNNLAI